MLFEELETIRNVNVQCGKNRTGDFCLRFLRESVWETSHCIQHLTSSNGLLESEIVYNAACMHTPVKLSKYFYP